MFCEIKQKLKEVIIFSSKNSVCLVALLLSIYIFIQELNSFQKTSYIYLKKTNQNLVMALIPKDCVSDSIRENSVWEKNETNYLVANVKPGDVVVECGANIGYYTVLLAKLVSTTGKVFSYEANNEVMDLANISLKINDLSDIVVLKNLCVSDKYGEVDFSINRDFSKFLGISFGSINRGVSHISLNSKEKNIKKVRTVTLDQDLSHLDQIDWLRMDIEGSEILALKGAKRLIESSPNLKIVTEWVPSALKKYGNLSKLIDYLFNNGFKAYLLKEDGISDRNLSKEELLTISHTDLVFKRE